MKNRFPREFYLPKDKGALKVADKLSTAIAYVYEFDNVKGRGYGAVCFRGKADKPDFHYTYRDASSRDHAVRQHFENVRGCEQRRRESHEKRKAFVHSARVGDIYRTSWGYDQTNVEFFEIVDLKGKYAILREIASASITNGPSESCVPQSGAYLEGERGAPIRRLIQDGRIKISDVCTAWPWGSRGPAGIIIGAPATRTASGWGH